MSSRPLAHRIFSKIKTPGTLLAAVFLVFLLLHIWSLMRFPPPLQDEAWLVSRAWGFIQTGHAFGILDSGLTEQFDHYWIVHQWLITVLHALVLRFFPAPVLMPVRVFSLVMGVGLLAVNYAVARRLLISRYGPAISTILLVSSLSFLYSAHIARYDILAALFAYAALAVVLIDRKGRFLAGLIAGLLTGLAVETHLNSLIFIPAIGVSFLIQYGWQLWRKGTFWGYALGLAAGLVYYLSLHYFPNPDTYRTINLLLFSHTQSPPLLSGSPVIMAQGLLTAGNLLMASAGSMVLLTLLAVPRLIARRRKEDLLLLALNLVMIVAAGLLMPTKPGHYSIYLAPIFLVLITSVLSADFQRPWSGKILDYLERIFIWGTVGGAIAISLFFMTPDYSIVYQRDEAKIKAVVQPGDVVMGTQNYWFGLVDHPYLSWELLFLYPRFHPGATIADAFQTLKPNIFIIDAAVQSMISDQFAPNSFAYYYHLPQKELMNYLDQHAVLVLDEKDGPNPLHIYRLKP